MKLLLCLFFLFAMKHEDARKRVCVLCFRKTGANECLENASALIFERINRLVISDLDLSDSRVPTGLCSSCRTKLKDVDGGRKSTFDLQSLSDYLDEQKRLSPRSNTCDCLVCKIATAFGGKANALLKQYKQASGRPKSPDAPSEIIHNLCGVCLSPTYRGSNHDKTRCGQTKYKLDNVYESLTEDERQQLASRVNRETAEEQGVTAFQLKTLGRPQTVTLGKPQESSFQISHEDADHMRSHAHLTQSQMLTGMNAGKKITTTTTTTKTTITTKTKP